MNTYNFWVEQPDGDYTKGVKVTQEAPTIGVAAAMLATKLAAQTRGSGLVATCKDGGVERRYELIDGQSYDVTPKGQLAPEVIGYYALHTEVLLVLVARPGKQLKLYTLPVAGENHEREANIDAVRRRGVTIPRAHAPVFAEQLFGRLLKDYTSADYELAW